MKKEAILESTWQSKAIEYVVYLCVFLIPLYINYSHWFPFGAPKNLFLICVVALLVILYGVKGFQEQRISIEFTWVQSVTILFLGVLTISGFSGVDPHNSFFGTWTQMNSIVMLIALALFSFFVGFLVKRNRAFLISVVSVSLASSVIVASITYGGVAITKLSSDGSTVGNNSYLGAYLLFNVCFGVAVFLWSKKVWQRVLAAIATTIVVCSAALLNRDIWSGKVGLSEIFKNPTAIFGNANGAILGLVVAFLVAIFLWWAQSLHKTTAVWGRVLFALLIGGLFFAAHLLVTPETAIHTIYALQKNENRFVFWDIAQQGFRDRPLFGNGMNNYSYTYQEYFNPVVFSPKHAPELWVNQPHNIFWEYASTTGILGLVGYCSLLGVTILALYKHILIAERRQKIVAIMLLGAIIGYVVQNLFVFDTIVPLLMFYTVVGIASGLSLQKSFSYTITGPIKNIAMGVCIVVGLFGIIWLVVLPWRESKEWGALASQTAFRDLANKRSNLQVRSVFGGVQDTAYLSDKFYQTIHQSIMMVNDTNKGYVLNEIASLKTTLKNDIKKQRDIFRAEMVLGQLTNLESYIKKNQEPSLSKEAREYFIKAQELNPKSPAPYLGITQSYLLENNIILARAAVVDALEIAPYNRQGYVVADELLKIVPDKKFAEYVEYMRKKYL